MPNLAIPVLVKHCTIAIYREGGISARSLKDKFIQAFKIARSRMAEYGFIVITGEALTSAIGLTPKGRARENKHKREGRAKTVLFDTLYDQYDVDGSRAAAEKQLREKAAASLARQDEAASAARPAKKSPAKTAPKPKRKSLI